MIRSQNTYKGCPAHTEEHNNLYGSLSYSRLRELINRDSFGSKTNLVLRSSGNVHGYSVNYSHQEKSKRSQNLHIFAGATSALFALTPIPN